MSFTYSPPNSIAQVRLRVGDTEQPAIFSDEEIQMVLDGNSSQAIIVGLSGYTPAVPVTQIYSYARASATLLNSCGAVRARALVKKVLDVELDPKAAMQSLRDLGQSYIDQEISAGFFSVAEFGLNSFWARERMTAMVLRQNC